MFLSVGADTVLQGADIIGIFDLDNVSRTRDTRRLLDAREKAGFVTTLDGDGIPRSLIVTCGTAGGRLYLSPISCATLRKRCEPGYCKT